MDATHAAATLRKRYPDIESVGKLVFRAVDRHDGRAFAVRYFDLRDNVGETARRLRQYQDEILGPSYYQAESRSDLRWNHYLYFIVDADRFSDDAFLRAKTLIEADREYARKVVVRDTDVESLLESRAARRPLAEDLPPDPLTIWTSILDQHSLGFVVDERLQVPAVVRHIADGAEQGIEQAPEAPILDAAEARASTAFLAQISIDGFRPFPQDRHFELGAVNLISGVNGVGKTSLLEAIEYLFCRKTRRADKPLPPNTAIRGTWEGSDLTLETTASTRHARLRARHLAWYGKAELRRLTLDDSFGKFNFLDTDAAVRLTVERSHNRLRQDLMQLLLGSESAKALDRLRRVSKQLVDAQKGLGKDIRAKDERRLDAISRAEALRKIPNESDEIFTQFVAQLSRTGWTDVPDSKEESAEMGDALQEASTNLRIVRDADPRLPRGATELAALRDGLSRARKQLDELAESRAEANREESEQRTHLEDLATRLEVVDEIAALVRSEVVPMSVRQGELQRELSQRSARLARAETGIDDLPPSLDREGMSLGDALDELGIKLADATARARQSRHALVEFERLQAVLTTELQRLRAAALAILEHTGDTNHCPLCRAAYSESDLKRRIDETTDGIAAADSERIRLEMQSAEAAVEQQTSQLAVLRALAEFAGGRGDLPVDEVVATVREERVRVGELRAELESLGVALRTQEDLGFVASRYHEIAAMVRFADTPPSVEEIEDTRLEIEQDRQGRANELAAASARRTETESKMRALAVANGISEADRTLTDLTSAFTARLQDAGDLLRAVEALSDRLALPSDLSYAELDAAVDEAQDVYISLRTAIGKERQTTEAVSTETKRAADAATEIEGMRIRRERMTRAQNVINNLLTTQSEQILLERVLQENAEAIGETFLRLHAPNEFMVSIGNGESLQILRRASSKSVDLEEMSSGQRAAYALSLFLAMNARLRHGPRVLLFDDPVSHVDDINTLSFLDYLRDIALEGQRQIFLATADARLEGLFVRKFRFLGDVAFRHIRLARDDLGAIDRDTGTRPGRNRSPE